MDIFFLLLFGHALGDFALQTEYMIKNKDRKNNPESWYIYATAHAVIHGGLVGFFTGSFVLAIAETVCHAVIDQGKCSGKIDFKIDQLLHIACKGLWIILLVKGLV
jgi:hypothetical protein